MKGVLHFKGVERTLTSFRLSHHKSTDMSGYPSSLPKASFFEVSFLVEEGDDFFMQWMCGKNIAHGGAKGFWYDGEIVFYDETSDGQELYRYDLQYVMPVHFRLEYDHQHGMEIHLRLTALDRVYNHLLHTESFYGYFFEYAKPKEKSKPMPKEEPVVYVRDFDADKKEAQPNEKVTYKVTKYSQEKVTENHKERIQWAIKIDGKQEVLKEKGEKLELTIKEEWVGKEIIVMPFLVKPDEKEVSKKVKVENGNPLKKHKEYVKHTLEEWAEKYKNYSWKEIATEAGWKDLQPLGPKSEWRYVENPIDGNIMDMRHVVVVGYGYGEKIGDGIEYLQSLMNKTKGSAFDLQDYYSNKIGAYFYQLRHSGKWRTDSWSYDFKRFIDTQYRILFKEYSK